MSFSDASPRDADSAQPTQIAVDSERIGGLKRVRAARRRGVFQRLTSLETDKCPFANLPEKRRTWWALTADEMKDCRWLKPERVAQIEFREWTPDGHLRHCRFTALRDDKRPESIVG